MKRQLGLLNAILLKVHPDKDDEDRLVWKANSTGRFSVKSLCGMLSPYPSMDTSFSFTGIWRGIVPPKVEIFCWMAIIKKINTRSMLVRKGILDISAAACPICFIEEESAIEPDFSYSASDLIRSAEGLVRWTNSTNHRAVVVWSPPMTNCFKWNVDGSSLGKPGPSGIGGVLRNHHGILLGIFSSPVGILDSNVAELKAVVKAIELSELSSAS
ncbi:uncharacterized protein [Populus alba]|uniref:uncharacterized protein n=1 Tax=Populus alba TaxID=43335 RepID=UPI003CC78D3A